jgi:DNA-directed RNA polymerase subunit alpha
MRINWKNLELPSKVVCDESTRTDRYACFVAEPFERGYGTTLGNSLRRVLLASIEGTAVTSVRIKDVKHEFSTIPGVIEDVTQISLNVKQLLVRLEIDKPKVLRLAVKKRKGPVTGADIETDGEAAVVNPDLVLCNLADPIDLEMEFTVKKGRGYVTADENVAQAGGEREIGVIWLDSIFSPVRRVRFRAENTRVGKLTNYDKLILEVWTSGTVTPEKSLVEAAKILRKHINAFVQFDQPGPELQQEPTRIAAEEAQGLRVERQADELEDRLSMPVEELELSVRALNCLEAESIKTVRELVSRSEEELMGLRNFGRTTLKEIKKKIEDLGLSLGMLAGTA